VQLQDKQAAIFLLAVKAHCPQADLENSVIVANRRSGSRRTTAALENLDRFAGDAASGSRVKRAPHVLKTSGALSLSAL